MSPLERLALRAYPPSFRDRYGVELAGLVDDLPGRRGTTPDLVRGAAAAWLRPPVRDRTARLRATVATVWVAWCAGFLVAPLVAGTLLDDGTVPGLPSWAEGVLGWAQGLFVAGWAVALVGALPVVAGAVWPALRRRDRALRPLVPPLVLGALTAAGLGALVLLRRSGPPDWPHPSVAFLAVGALWLLVLALFVASLGIGPALSVQRLRPDAAMLRVPALLAAAVALLLIALTATSLAAAVSVHVGPRSEAQMAVGLVVACCASAVAAVSALRGLRGVRA